MTRDDIHVTSGKIEPVNGSDKQFRIATANMRGEFNKAPNGVSLTFTYLGVTDDVNLMASGKVRTQIGLKLRSENTCNVGYVMWQIQPPKGLVISAKENEGMTKHSECGPRGYHFIVGKPSIPLPPVEVGSTHTLAANLDGDQLTVFADGKKVWSGEFEGPSDGRSGMRSDNGVFEFSAKGQ